MKLAVVSFFENQFFQFFVILRNNKSHLKIIDSSSRSDFSPWLTPELESYPHKKKLMYCSFSQNCVDLDPKVVTGEGPEFGARQEIDEKYPA